METACFASQVWDNAETHGSPRKCESPLLACALSDETMRVTSLQEMVVFQGPLVYGLWKVRLFVQRNTATVFTCRNIALFGHEDGFLPKDDALFLRKVLS